MATRPEQISEDYMLLIDKHLDDLVKGQVDAMLTIEDFAEKLHIHPTHFSNTIKETNGQSPCGIYQIKILEIAKKLLLEPDRSIKEIALLLTFEPAQFTKWFKRFTDLTPKAYREKLKW